jgi:predicted RND superfamily exporter protein
MSVGIVVDDTIHFVISYRRNRAQGLSQQQSIDASYSQVGRAIVITSVILCIGFSIPALFASLAMNTLLYSLMICCVAKAAIVDLWFLPALLIKIEKY